MDPPENSVNRIGRTIWTVWGYLSGAVARYLRPEVTAEGNQSVHARTDEIDLKSAVNKIDREVKTNNSDDENDSAEVKRSSSKVRAAASVQWENTGAVKSDDDDKLHVHTTKKQTYNCAAWSTGTETDSEGRTAEKVSSDEVQAEEEHANCESEERETTQEPQVTGETEQTDGDNKEECDENHEVEKCAEKREDADNTDVMIQSEQDVELDTQISVTDRGETQDTGGLKHEHPTDETEKQITVQKNQEKTENDEDQGTEPQVQDLLDYLTDEANSISKPERLKQIDKYSEEIYEFSQSGIEEMRPGSATEQDEESQTAQDLEEIGRFGQKDGDGEERDQDREVEKCDVMREDWSNTDVMIQSEQDVELDTQISVTDRGETQDTGGLKHEHPTDETEKQITVQKNQEKTENDEDQGTEPQVQDLLDYLTDEAYSISKPERLKQIDKYSEEIADVSKNQIEEMMPGSATEQDEESQTAQDLEEIGRFGQKDGDGEERDQDREVEKCDVMREDWSNTDVMIQSEQDVELDTQISVTDRGETQDTGGLKHEHPTDETEKQITVQKNQEKTENDEDQGTEPQVQDLLDYLTDEAYSISKPERLKQIDKYSEEIYEFSQSGIEEMRPGSATEQDEESQTAQDLEEIGRFGQKDGDGEERDQDREVEKCDVMREDWSNTDVMIQSEQDVELDTQISVTDRGETQDTGGLKHEHPTDETEKQITVQKNQEKTENDEDQGTEPQVQDLLDYLTDEANSISKPERLNQIDKYSEEIDEFSQSGIEEMRPGTEQDEDTTNREQDMTKYELIESAETLQRESESEKHVPNDETELKMPTVTDETVDSLEDTLLSDSEQDTLENTPESGTGSSVLATKTEGMFSDLTVCEFPGESKLHDAQSPAGERAERDSEDDTETLIQAERQQIHKTQLSLEEHVEFRTELIVETEDEEAEAFETESRSAVIRNVTLQPHELLEFTGGQCTSSQGAMDTFSETQGNASASDITGTAEHVSEDQTDVKPVSMRSLSPTQLLEEPLDLQADVAKTALEYVEQITNQVLKEMKEAECNLVQKTEPLVGLSTEEAGDAEHQAPAQCVSDASVLEEERTLLAETMDSSEEHISSAECENTDGRHEQMQKSIAGETVLRSHEDLMEVSRPGMKRGFDQVSKGLPEVKTEGEFNLILQAFEDSSLDFSVQKSRIAVKNPLVRPPKDPRKLLFRASAEPLPQPSDRSRTLQVSAPSKGMIGFKLPGLGAGLPVLRRTEFVQKAEAERTLQPQKSVAVTEDSVKQEQVPAKPKWTPPRHPGMGSPFMMAELKNKLKKPVQE
ncbi:claspin isoform X2 [Onychostoma macrolepis]|uniref:Uncharacterized protein n=1 Tax=Onychostoma macrolepis TaxID=369639 RepID=A0A7J6CID5_9TELE|nr:claspin isoform X2 [Onychostoma macrolepis]KAF4107020.1 hypothetical protein G5714_013010 [Onychostoma macrolepis]